MKGAFLPSWQFKSAVLSLFPSDSEVVSLQENSCAQEGPAHEGGSSHLWLACCIAETHTDDTDFLAKETGGEIPATKNSQGQVFYEKAFFLQECAQKEGCPGWHGQIMLPVMDNTLLKAILNMNASPMASICCNQQIAV